MLCTFSISNCEKDFLPLSSKPSRSFEGGFRDGPSPIYLGVFFLEIMATVSRLGTANRLVSRLTWTLSNNRTIFQVFPSITTYLWRHQYRIFTESRKFWKRLFSPKICISIERINLQCLKCHRLCAGKL